MIAWIHGNRVELIALAHLALLVVIAVLLGGQVQIQDVAGEVIQTQLPIVLETAVHELLATPVVTTVG